MRNALRFPRRVRRVEAIESLPVDSPSILPEAVSTRRVDALTAYRHELIAFRGDVLTRARELDAMRREELLGRLDDAVRVV